MSYSKFGSVKRPGARIFGGRRGCLALMLLMVAFLFAPVAEAEETLVDISTAGSGFAMKTLLQWAINRSSAGDTVTVIGSKSVSDDVAMDIASGVTVKWNATLNGSRPPSASGLLKISGPGTFETMEEALISANGLDTAAIHVRPGGTTININGGKVVIIGNRTVAIRADGIADGIKINVSGKGIVSATGSECKAIFADGSGGASHINVASGASVEADGPGSYSIYAVHGATISADQGTLVGPSYEEETDNNNNNNNANDSSGCDAGIGWLSAIPLAGFLFFKKPRA
jgi:hypothetical protein